MLPFSYFFLFNLEFVFFFFFKSGQTHAQADRIWLLEESRAKLSLSLSCFP